MTPLRLKLLVLLTLGISFLACRPVAATQADDTTITITGKFPGPTALIKQVGLLASATDVLKSIQFTIEPKTGSVTRPLSGTYGHDYLVERGYLDPATGTIFVPVYGLYGAFSNRVTLTYLFTDGSSTAVTTIVATDTFADSCNHQNPTVVQARSASTALSYDFMLVRGTCDVSPVILDTDGEVRWISPFNTSQVITASSGFFRNAVYVTRDSFLYRIDLDGTMTQLADYASLGVVNFHHNIDRGKSGIILDADTTAYTESDNLEVDESGAVLKAWNMADIISAVMLAGGDDPSQFVFPAPADWFHNNAVAYKRSNDSLIVSGREDFVVSLDYQTLAVQWILGDKTKKWFEFPSLARYALALTTGSLPPIGEHAVSVTLDNNLFMMDNGRNSLFQVPAGINRDTSFPRKYAIDQAAQTATELMDYPGTENLYTQFCGSAYEDAKSNYLTDYAFVTRDDGTSFAEILGYEASGAKVFDYMYNTGGCSTAYNSLPLHLESSRFPTVGPQALNLSTRARVGTGDQALIGGFIVTGTGPKTVVLRALGPSLGDADVSGALPNPKLSVFNSTGTLIAANDNWESDPAAEMIANERLAPTDPLEAATSLTLSPGAYTAVVTGQNATTGVGLLEAYDLSAESGSILANISARGFVGTADDVLIAGFIIGDVESTTIIARALGPSLPAGSVGQPLSDPLLTVYDSNGLEVGTNDNWQDNANATDVAGNGLAPGDATESALLLNLPAGAYSAIVRGADGGTGVGLVEVYNIP
jgi:arylsulfate sulfotransferase